ncbi:hypothetical protein [Tenacibaculum ovolyticum]|uniref:hypothetical protein n=1 Tax=Tenacibaculum ovolyticum TaxID=104270 RepID=UPI0007ED276B|nr:hypothetical protein [Tenacibaculum ovolyticum]
MKKIKKKKKIWVKRLYLDRGQYDYFKIDSDQANAVMRAEKQNPNPNFKIIKPEWYILLLKKTIDFLNLKIVSSSLNRIIFIIIGFILKWLWDKYIS